MMGVNDVGVVEIEERKGSASGADIDSLPEAIEDKDLGVECHRVSLATVN